jgi:hypothetical protein
MIKFVDIKPKPKQGYSWVDEQQATDELNEWLEARKPDPTNMAMPPVYITVINIETLYKDASSYGAYQPMFVGIRVWYEQK